MALVKPKKMLFPPSASPDVTAYRLFIEPTATPTNLAYTSQNFDLGMPTANADGKLEVDLGGIDVLRTLDGVYDIGVVAIDDAGNQSSMSTKMAVPLDFSAPDAPGPVEVV